MTREQALEAVVRRWISQWVTEGGTLIMGAPYDLIRASYEALARKDDKAQQQGPGQ